MSRRAAAQTLSYMVDESASEDEFAKDSVAMMVTSDPAIENAAPAGKKKASTKPKAAPSAKATATRARPTRRSSGVSVVTGKPKAARKAPAKRKALAERSEPNASDTEEVEEFDEPEELPEAAPPAKRTRGRPKRDGDDESIVSTRAATAAAKKTKAQPKARGRATKKEPSAEAHVVIPETQPDLDLMDIEPSIEDIPELPDPEPLPKQSHRSGSVAKQRAPASFRRAGSVSDTERAGSDPMLRRKLGDMTKRFENLDIKYRNLREVGVRDADTNFEKLKQSTETRARAQDELIASLKRELATQRALATESKSLKYQVAELVTANKSLSSENKSLHAQLSESQAEIKTLTTKLAATRATSVSAETKMPGSAVKTQRTVMVGSADAAKDAQIRQLKEDLYSDLTGLIIRGVKRGEEEDVYDCIQTGRNGTLHFHLSIADSQSYEDAEFAYTPLLDDNRDRDLLEILPDYLTEEICFPRSSAAKFYAKVVDCMTRRVVVEE